MTTFNDYKKKRKNVGDLISKIKDANEKKKKDYTDDRIFKYTKDKTGNAFAVLRFLPSKNDLPPIISTFQHSFQHRGRWFINECPTTIKQKCPVCESNNQFWGEDSTEQLKNIGRQRSRKKFYYSNVYVVKDSENTDNEGKVMIFRYGQKVYEKIMAKLQPEFDSDDVIDVFDLFAGANFKLKIRTVAGYSNYDNCEFMTPAPLFDDDKKLENVFNEIYDLSEFIDAKKFGDYDRIKSKLERIIGETVAPVATSIEEKATTEPEKTPEIQKKDDSEDEDETDEYFEELK